MAVGQNRLSFPLSMGDALGYVEGGLWPKEDAVKSGAESIAELSMFRVRMLRGRAL
jgi:hypothetical protein